MYIIQVTSYRSDMFSWLHSDNYHTPSQVTFMHIVTMVMHIDNSVHYIMSAVKYHLLSRHGIELAQYLS